MQSLFEKRNFHSIDVSFCSTVVFSIISLCCNSRLHLAFPIRSFLAAQANLTLPVPLAHALAKECTLSSSVHLPVMTLIQDFTRSLLAHSTSHGLPSLVSLHSLHIMHSSNSTLSNNCRVSIVDIFSVHLRVTRVLWSTTSHYTIKLLDSQE